MEGKYTRRNEIIIQNFYTKIKELHCLDEHVYEQAGVAVLLSNIGLNPTSASLFVAAALHIILSLTLLVVANIVNLGTVLNATISTAVLAASSWHLE
ncbi:unnamed protein product [Malus baccata var. baccata]